MAPGALARRLARASWAFVETLSRYSASRLVSTSIKSLNNQRRTHFPRLTEFVSHELCQRDAEESVLLCSALLGSAVAIPVSSGYTSASKQRFGSRITDSRPVRVSKVHQCAMLSIVLTSDATSSR